MPKQNTSELSEVLTTQRSVALFGAAFVDQTTLSRCAPIHLELVRERKRNVDAALGAPIASYRRRGAARQPLRRRARRYISKLHHVNDRLSIIVIFTMKNGRVDK